MEELVEQGIEVIAGATRTCVAVSIEECGVKGKGKKEVGISI